VARPRSFRLKLLAACLVLAAAAVLSRSLWLPVLGYALVHDDGPAKADMAVVLAGDPVGHRIEKAAELVRDGYVPAALISGPAGYYGLHESDFEIAYAVRRGLPAEWFIALPNSALSTQEEAAVVLAELRRRNVRSFLLVTSDFHTARARRIFLAAERATGGGPAMRTVAAPDEFFRPDSWWRNREGQKTAFFEWCKNVASALGI
jgi:uncharacterized SAM-binding protein YcdF (DUF218 family)